MPLPIRHRLVALLMLLAYASVSTAALPAVVSWLALVEGSHSVQVTQSAKGMQITLHHARGDFTPKVADHKSALARLMVSLCKVADSGDHHLDASQLSEGSNGARDPMTAFSGKTFALLAIPLPSVGWCLALALRSVQVLKAKHLWDHRRRAMTQLATIQLVI